MGLKHNIRANYISQIYITVIGIAIVPLYLKYMGAEAYGLVGFFAMLQAWFNLFDMGLTPTVGRETARFRGGALDAITFRRLVRALEGIFLGIAVLGSCTLVAASGWIAAEWLNVQELPISEVKSAVQLIVVSVALRWMSGLYRGQVSGSERFVWLSGYNMLIATLRLVGVLPVLIFFSITPTAFFSYQLCVAIIELGGLIMVSHRLLPTVPDYPKEAWSWRPLKPVLKFSLNIAFTSSVWVLVTQTDKLILSKILPLAEYGYFTLAVVAASGVLMISVPTSSAIIPRMVKLESEGDDVGLIRTYRQATQLVAVISGGAASTVAVCAEPLVWIWTGDKTLTQYAAPILLLYTIGNSIQNLAAFPSYLQYAKGNLRLHAVGSFGFGALLIPSIFLAARQYGGLGAGYCWVAINVIYFMIWVPVVHAKFAHKLNVLWFKEDVLAIVLPMSALAWGLSHVLFLTKDRWLQFGVVASIAASLLMAGVVSSTVVRRQVKASFSALSNDERSKFR